jgi:heme-degrading monooxygenase HmoA
MAKAVVTEFRVQKRQTTAFERFVVGAMKRSRRAEGQQGAILLRAVDKPTDYLMLAFWRTKAERERFLRAINARVKLRGFTDGRPTARWMDTIARVQDARFLGSA